MTAGNNGTGTPENDDPFGYLYRSEGGDGSTSGGQPATHQPGVPRTSYNQVRPVGSRQYGQPPAASRPNPHYAAPETLAGGAPGQGGPQQPGAYAPAGGHGSHGGSERPKRRGLLIAAIAVVAVVATGIGVAMVTNGSSNDGSKTSASGGDNKKPDSGDSKKKDDSSKKDSKDEPQNPSANGQQKRDAASLRLSGGATTEKTVQGAEADGGTYITGMNAPGASVEWTVDVQTAGQYRLNLRYGVPGKDANLTVWENGNKDERAIRMSNYGAKPGDWAGGWFTSWSNVKLNKGTNTLKLSCEPGNACEAHLDQVWLSAG
ncbi:hypothetical protein FHS39_000935 [Streptomyces olivoverticillatus]|uniref:CBM6 domain-containing protein n=1 Tax=Streptomyces olivoverticillatus TaxID=66427 RepID=A0A7W7PKM5_9ACTN|nr:carbohydrate-binding protein [Streptomyces olivoverticillatus]MBB4891935.1 hypothetical protein [Streptomyces olivoverticillatus]